MSSARGLLIFPIKLSLIGSCRIGSSEVRNIPSKSLTAALENLKNVKGHDVSKLSTTKSFGSIRSSSHRLKVNILTGLSHFMALESMFPDWD